MAVEELLQKALLVFRQVLLLHLLLHCFFLPRKLPTAASGVAAALARIGHFCRRRDFGPWLLLLLLLLPRPSLFCRVRLVGDAADTSLLSASLSPSRRTIGQKQRLLEGEPDGIIRILV